ncbi:MAG: alkaline phosphatase PhoX, partial [Candidatus Poseidoniaceae archaeon]
GIYSAHDGQQILLSQKPDYNAFIPTNSDGTTGYLYTAWEDRPAGISQVELEWNPSSSEWDVLSKQMLNLSDINGAWVLCFGSVSPWSTPLFSEELYFDDTEDWNNDGYRYHSDQLRLEQYLGHYPNPYDYGYIIEMEQATSTTPELIRHLTMGRFSHENALVMPDNKTVYLTDDGYETVFFKFEADTAGDLSEGTLYSAKVTQDSTYNSASTGFDVEWLELGSSSNDEIQGWIDDYDGITTADYIQGENSYITDEEINNWAEDYLNQDLNNDGTIGYALDDRVAFLETRKAAAAIGATDEWNKMEGVGFNQNAPDNLYLAMSSIDNAMTDGQGDIDVSDNLCGIVYQMTMNELWN